MNRQFTDVAEFLPELTDGETFKIKHFTLDKQTVMMEIMRNARDYWLVRGLQADYKYTKLIMDGQIWMSDTPMERNTNTTFLRSAKGDVIIFGLGIGLIIYPLLKDPTVTSITVVELSKKLIEIVAPAIKAHDTENKLSIIQGDAYHYKSNIPKGKKFDTIYFDIWVEINLDNYEDIKELERKYKVFLNKDGFMGSWMKPYYQQEKRREYREKQTRWW